MDHTRRVYRWMLELYVANESWEQIDIESLKIEIIFHDCGYGRKEQGEHAEVGAEICRKYLSEKNYEEKKIFLSVN